LLITATPVAADQSGIRAALLMDFETGQVLFAQNIDQALPPASITKLMSMHLIFEAISEGRSSLTDKVTASANASNLPPGSSTIFLGTGEVLTVEELLRAVAIISANDAGIALAEHVAGSESAFVNMMNEKAVELGMTNTTFVNSHGLHTEGHNMSARDIGILSRATIELYPEVLEFSAQKFVRMERETRYVRQGYFDMHSTYANLIGWRKIDGLKTGWTPEALRGITVTAEEAGRRYIVVVLGAESTGIRDGKVRELLALGLDHFVPQTPVKAGEVMDSIEIKHAKNKEAAIVSAQDVTLVMRRGESVDDYEKKIEILPNIQAPLSKGDVVGSLSYFQDGELMTSVDLVLEEDLAKANFFTRSLRFLSQALTNLGSWIIDLVK
jgi:D-alanyl-D-alanine carboxypeptidase (penicillin-binding protein 5/6)